MNIQLSDHFTYKKLLGFVLSPVLMMICSSLYSIVDGVFVANFVGKTPFAAINLIMPVLMGVGSIGMMLGTGGSAIVAKTLGEGKRELANRYFSLMVYVAVFLGIALSAIGFVFMRPISVALGATEDMINDCVIYGRILFVSQTLFILQNMFQSFFATAEKPQLSLIISVASGLTNVFLDFLFIVVFHLGLAGAAYATAIGQAVGGLVPIVYFARKNDSLLQLTHTKYYGKIMAHACANGSSEMVTNLSTSLVSILYNFQLMKIAGENGVAAYGVIMYVNFVFMAIFFGYSIGSAPIVSYHYGAANHDELKNLFRKSIVLLSISGIVLTVFSELLTAPLVKIFAGQDIELYTMTSYGFRIYALSFLLMGFNVWGSAFFTALNNGLISATISFLRTFLLQFAAVLILPIFFGITGIWLAVVAAELFTLFVTLFFFIEKRNTYHYL